MSDTLEIMVHVEDNQVWVGTMSPEDADNILHSKAPNGTATDVALCLLARWIKGLRPGRTIVVFSNRREIRSAVTEVKEHQRRLFRSKGGIPMKGLIHRAMLANLSDTYNLSAKPYGKASYVTEYKNKLVSND